MLRTSSALLTAMVLLAVGPAAFAATVDFETLAAGSTYGTAAGNAPGDVILTQDDIQVSVEEFYLTASSFTGFVEAEAGGQTATEFPTQPLSLNNISVKFDLSGVSFPVGYVSLQYVDLGGEENISVNGGTINEVAALTAVGAAVAPGVSLAVFENPIAGGASGEIVLTGPVTSLTIGGQEFGIDDLIVAQDPPDDPNDPQGDPNDPMGDPNDPQGDPNDPQGDPNDPMGDPNDPMGDPNDPHGDPNDPHGDPNDPHGDPNGDPNDPMGGPTIGDITVNCGGMPGVMMTLVGLLGFRFVAGRKSW